MGRILYTEDLFPETAPGPCLAAVFLRTRSQPLWHGTTCFLMALVLANLNVVFFPLPCATSLRCSFLVERAGYFAVVLLSNGLYLSCYVLFFVFVCFLAQKGYIVLCATCEAHLQPRPWTEREKGNNN